MLSPTLGWIDNVVLFWCVALLGSDIGGGGLWPCEAVAGGGLICLCASVGGDCGLGLVVRSFCFYLVLFVFSACLHGSAICGGVVGDDVHCDF